MKSTNWDAIAKRHKKSQEALNYMAEHPLTHEEATKQSIKLKNMALEDEIKRYTEEKYHETFGNRQGTLDEFDWEDIDSTIEETARHFTEWQKAKVLEVAVEGLVCATLTGTRAISFLSPLPDELNAGDKVRVIVIKEDEK